MLRATTTVVAACTAGCASIVPVADREAALAAASQYPVGEVLLAGERGGLMIAGVPPRQLAARVRHRARGGPHADLHHDERHARRCCTRVGPPWPPRPALVNVEAAAHWALEQDRDLAVLCAGERRAFSLEDAVCAGILVDHVLRGAGSAELTDAALAALRIGEFYAERLDRLALESEWGRHLARQGRAADLEACLSRRHVVAGAGVRVGRDLPRPTRSDVMRPTGITGAARPTARERPAMNVPIALTLFRIVLVPFIIVFLISSDRVHVLIAAVIFMAASLTDWLDGRMARRWNQVTRLGTLLDPVADKVLVAAALVALVQIDMVEAWVAVVIIGRELAVTGLRGVALSMGGSCPRPGSARRRRCRST